MTGKQTNEPIRPIDIKDVFKEKNPRLAPLIPGFIYRFIHNMLALDYINEILRLHGDKRDFEFADASIEMFDVTVDLEGEHHLPQGGPFIFVSNHPLGGFDGVLLIREIGERYNRKYKVLVNDILLNIKNMDGIFVPVNKHGVQAMENVKRIDEIFRSENHVMTFPAGLVSRRKKGKIEDPEWKKNFITKAVQYKRDIIPIHFSGRCSDFFYKIANLRKKLGIKSNLEMFLLPRETFKHRNGHYNIKIGKPVGYKTFDKRYKPIEWAEKMKQHCYRLENNIEQSFMED
ncbi:MAG: 1-acyl-sn-glycerol-3-phosphate acyltransferase [Bacteroidales bacterium]|nr:1-acyl-sn-glycerol-3-phosphate acyltransferase [Bacteroidales bacterium]